MHGLSDYLEAIKAQPRYPSVWGGHYRDSVLLAQLFHDKHTATSQAIYEVLLPLALCADISSAALIVNDHISRRIFHGSFLVTETGWVRELHVGHYSVDDFGKLVVNESRHLDWMPDDQSITVDALAEFRNRNGGNASLEAALLTAIQHKQ